MMPPMSGKQASAAATFDGRSVDVGRAVPSEPGAGGGTDGGGGAAGSTGSGMSQINTNPARASKLCVERDFAYAKGGEDDTVRSRKNCHEKVVKRFHPD